jgi:hypothetical protein
MRMKSVARQVEALGGLASDLRSCRVLLKCIWRGVCSFVGCGVVEIGKRSCFITCASTIYMVLMLGWPKSYIHTYIWCIYGISSREVTIHTVIYSAHIWFWPTLFLCNVRRRRQWRSWCFRFIWQVLCFCTIIVLHKYDVFPAALQPAARICSCRVKTLD